MTDVLYRPDLSLKGKVRRRLVRLYRCRRIAARPPRPMLTFTFDDILASAAEVGADILERAGHRATFFVCGGLAGRPGPIGRHATAQDIRRLARAGHEIGCHSHSHLDCGGADEEAVSVELERNRQALLGWDLPTPRTFAYPYGDVARPVKRLTHDAFSLARGVHAGALGRGSDLNQAPGVCIDGPGGEARADRWMARAHARGEWLILVSHAVTDGPGEFNISPASLERLATSAAGRGFEVVTAREGAERLAA